MKKGDIVTIYRHPMQRELPEGTAELIHFVEATDYGERWHVRFIDQPEVNPDARFIAYDEEDIDVY